MRKERRRSGEISARRATKFTLGTLVTKVQGLLFEIKKYHSTPNSISKEVLCCDNDGLSTRSAQP